MKSILSAHAQEDRLIVIEDFTIESGKTKDLVAILNNFAKDERTVLSSFEKQLRIFTKSFVFPLSIVKSSTTVILSP